MFNFLLNHIEILVFLLLGTTTLFVFLLLLSVFSARRKMASVTVAHGDELFALEKMWQSKVHIAEVALGRESAISESLESQRVQLQNSLTKASLQIEDLVRRNARYEEQQSLLEKEYQFIQHAKEQLLKDFELATNKLYEQKHSQFSKSSKESVEAVLSPLKTQLQVFNQRIEDMVHQEGSQRNQLAGQILQLQKQAHKLSVEANSLASALKGDNKSQGDWGEVILERLLESSGLERGREYVTQQSYVAESGRRQRPDVIVCLPDGKDIVIDAKVSLVAYERFVSCETDAERKQAQSAHVDSIRSHMRGLSLKNYEGLEGLRTLDFVFMFIPIEGAYAAAVHANPMLFNEAYERSIILVSPSSLMAALKTVETIWRHEKQNNNAEKIAQSAGRLYDQFVLMLEAFDDIGAGIKRTQDAYSLGRKRLTEGRGNLVTRVEQLRVLGAKTAKKMPPSYSDVHVGAVSEKELDDKPGLNEL